MGMGQMSSQSAGMGLTSQDQYDQVVRQEQFTELAIPSRPHNLDYCEGILHHAARPQMQRRQQKLKWKVHPLETI